MARVTLPSFLILMLLAVPAAAQVPLTLADAVAQARRQHPDVLAADARVTRATAGVREARAARLPRLDVVEGWQRGDMPVFAFSSRLSQRRLSADDFDIGRLNDPLSVDIFRTSVVIEQPVIDVGVRAAVRTATLDREMAVVEREQVQRDMTLATIEAYGQVLRLEALTTAASSAVEAAREDLAHATATRDAGRATDADVLMATVQEAAARDEAIDIAAQLAVTRARLNFLMGEPLDAVHALAPIAVVADVDELEAANEADALSRRADVRLAWTAERLAHAGVAAARAAFVPQVVARAAVEANGASFGSRARGWVVTTEVRWNVFRGFGDSARLAQARAVADERRLARAAATDRARLDIRAARTAVSAARARVDLSHAAVSAARESQRIVRDRYDNGLVTGTDLLRASQAVADADARAIAAASDAAIAHAHLQAALGVL